jgi:hypothetical protein
MQEWIVAIIVAYAAWVVAKRYMPKAVKQTVRMQIARTAKKLGWGRVASKFEPDTQTVSSSCADGCGTCGGCGSKDASPVEKQSATTVKVLTRAGPR